MMWADLVADRLTPSFGGFPTFCSDPDDLLEEPSVREALAKRNVALHEWTGEPAELAQWANVPEESMPLVKHGASVATHLIEETLPDATRLDIGVGTLFPNLDAEVVRSVAKGFWDILVRLQRHERPLRTRRESALMVARAVYGIDHVFAREHGWVRGMAQVAASGEGLPELICNELVSASERPNSKGVQSALHDPAVARSFLRDVPHEDLDPIAEYLRAPAIKESRHQQGYGMDNLVAQWQRENLSVLDVQELSIAYASEVFSAGSTEARAECNRGFFSWLTRSYDLLLSSQNAGVLRIHKLRELIDARLGKDRGIVFMVDALGLESWLAVKRRWIEDKIILDAHEEAAFAIIPTLTSWSRRSFFEGKLPTQFDKSIHGPPLERRLWQGRFPEGSYFDIGETSSIQDAIYQGTSRIAVVDVSWDKRGHALDPEYDSLASKAQQWGTKSQVAGVLRLALDNGYRAFLIADHGQVEGRGIGVPNVGSVPEDRSKRVLVFGAASTRDTFAKVGEAFHPITMPRDAVPLFARYGESFDILGATSFSHGGCSIEEVMIPFVEINP